MLAASRKQVMVGLALKPQRADKTVSTVSIDERRAQASRVTARFVEGLLGKHFFLKQLSQHSKKMYVLSAVAGEATRRQADTATVIHSKREPL